MQCISRGGVGWDPGNGQWTAVPAPIREVWNAGSEEVQWMASPASDWKVGLTYEPGTWPMLLTSSKIEILTSKHERPNKLQNDISGDSDESLGDDIECAVAQFLASDEVEDRSDSSEDRPLD
eukprot:gnl/MRDRNA2_/MRDRNA2_17871_c0_seq2.p1 gnl/MRDRNA2_/MRDRNA2_17871_c0~~gnl/MRDRNA2_/MRDRNA2_17871_c0_seq2.p1  ORF type:complete len:122 (+),score=25.44 gnl/MRDRNA2_/MRDRNA2_17871_c0_seq2:178-543(+)